MAGESTLAVTCALRKPNERGRIGRGTATDMIPTPQLLSVIIPARNEEGSVGATIRDVHGKLSAHAIPHEIIVVNDGSTDGTRALLHELCGSIPVLRLLDNTGPHGFGRTVRLGLENMRGDAVVLFMADESDSPDDLVRYWELLRAGHDCVFGSRFIEGGAAQDYPLVKLVLNRLANTFIRLLFGIAFNDTTNAFKAYRREAIELCQPLESADFNLTVELPLKAIVRGCTFAVTPIRWRNRRTGLAKLKIHEMGSRYLRVITSVWREQRHASPPPLRCCCSRSAFKLLVRLGFTLYRPFPHEWKSHKEKSNCDCTPTRSD